MTLRVALLGMDPANAGEAQTMVDSWVNLPMLAFLRAFHSLLVIA